MRALPPLQIVSGEFPADAGAPARAVDAFARRLLGWGISAFEQSAHEVEIMGVNAIENAIARGSLVVHAAVLELADGEVSPAERSFMRTEDATILGRLALDSRRGSAAVLVGFRNALDEEIVGKDIVFDRNPDTSRYLPDRVGLFFRRDLTSVFDSPGMGGLASFEHQLSGLPEPSLLVAGRPPGFGLPLGYGALKGAAFSCRDALGHLDNLFDPSEEAGRAVVQVNIDVNPPRTIHAEAI